MFPELLKLRFRDLSPVDIDYVVLALPVVGDGTFAESGGGIVVDPGLALFQVGGAGFYGFQVRQNSLAGVAGVDQGHGLGAVVVVPEGVADGDVENVGNGLVGE